MKYKRFGTTRKEIIILDEWVEVKWHSRNISKYVDLGYTFTRKGDYFWCHVDDMPSSPTLFVLAQCPICGIERNLSSNNIIQAGHTICNGCSSITDLEGLVFGKLTVIEFDGTDDSGAKWLCECECGTVKSITGWHLTGNRLMSCGCYVRELGRARCGENHPSWKGGETKLVCEWCGNEYKRAPSLLKSKQSRFCSNACQGEWMSETFVGENNPAWNPDTTHDERILRRNYPEYRKYTKVVMKRDNYTCQVCGEYGGRLQVHHLYSYSDYPEYQLVVDYGTTICVPCHTDFHSWMGGYRVECVPEDFDEWLREIGLA